jgi:hypothetical protein
VATSISGSYARSHADVPHPSGGKIAIELETPPKVREGTAAEPLGFKRSKSETGDMMKKWYSLIDKVYRPENLEAAYRAVRANKGAPGIDGVTVEAYGQNLEEKLRQLHHELKTGTYEPLPVRRVEIPKPDGGVRLLGVPSTRDRVVQQALLNELQPIFDPGFHPSSYGYRPGRSCQQAVAKAERFLNRYRLEYVVDMDLSKCFDRLDHGLILQGVNQKVSDGSVLKLIVNAKKTHIASVQEGVAYLGFVIYPKYVAISKKKIKAFKDRIQQLTPRNHGMNVEAMIVQLNPVLRGWANYFRVANCKKVFQELMQWVRRRLRMKQMREWKSWKPLFKALHRRGYHGEFLKISMTRWRNSASPLINMALPNSWLDELGLVNLDSYQVGILHHFFEK